MKWNEHLMEWLLDLTTKLQRDPYALWPACVGFVFAMVLIISPGVLKLRLTHTAKGTLWTYPELSDAFNVLWMSTAAVGLILFCKGLNATFTRLKKAGQIPN